MLPIVAHFTKLRAHSHLARGRAIVVAGCIGRPYLTTDAAAVSLALELDCDAIFKATKPNLSAGAGAARYSGDGQSRAWTSDG